jgi:hypothetical protein
MEELVLMVDGAEPTANSDSSSSLNQRAAINKEEAAPATATARCARCCCHGLPRHSHPPAIVGSVSVKYYKQPSDDSENSGIIIIKAYYACTQ